ncbi:hypothetical protein Q5752_005591 [Cryptotrichosporon argae]
MLSLNDAGPSSVPGSRATSPAPGAALRRPASHGRLAQLMVSGRSRSSSTASQDAVTAAVTAYGEESAGSGRMTPEMRRRSARAAAASLLANDAKYKKFAAQVDRCLQSFESVNEWADFISFLSRLLKTLQTPSPSYSEIPRKLIVAKRLAQCLNPALPSGVHTRALDVYSFVFATIGHDGLRRDLLIWSSGLFPFFQFASTSVRPAVIKLYEQYYIPLGEDLRPATKAMILALLPGLEEETGDFFDKILALLSTLSDAVSPSFFLQNIFLILVSAPASRLAALNYLARRLLEPPATSGNDDNGLMIRGVAASLGDDNMLVRRNALDLLLRVLPLDGDIMSTASQADKEYLTRSASEVILHRDMSLSRRVYTWLLGKEETAAQQVAYLQTHGLDLLVGTLQADMQKIIASDATDAHTPYKVFLSFLDKWEIAESLSTRLAIPALVSLRQAAFARADASHSDALSTAAAIYDNVEPELLWSTLARQIVNELRDGQTAKLDLLLWLVTSSRQHDDETTQVHVPKLLDTLLGLVDTNEVSPDTLASTLRLSSALLSLIPGQVFALATPHQESRSLDGESSAEAPRRAQADTNSRIVQATFDLCKKVLLRRDASTNVLLLALDMTQTLVNQDVGLLAAVDGGAWLRAVTDRVARATSFAVVERAIDTALKASRTSSFSPHIDIAAAAVTSIFLGALFRYLRPRAAVHHVRAVELLWEYNQLAEVHALETVVAMRIANVTGQAEAYDAFGVLWRQTDDAVLPGEIFYAPMLRVLDGLRSDDPAVVSMAETWMRCSMRSYFRILDPILHRLLLHLRATDKTESAPAGDLAQLRYLLQTLLSLFNFGGQGLSRACQASEASRSAHASFVELLRIVAPNANTYLDLLVDLLTRLVAAETRRRAGKASAGPRDKRVQAASLALLELLVSFDDMSKDNTAVIRECLLDKLEASTRNAHLDLQNSMLRLLHAAIAATADRPKGHRTSASLSTLSEKAPPNEHPPEFDIHLLRVCVNGLSVPTNRPVLQHWIDFVLMLSPYLERRPHLMLDLCDCASEQLRVVMRTLRDVYDDENLREQACDLTDAEPVMLLSCIERIASLLVGRAPGRRSEDALRAVNDEGKGILGYLPTVFAVEAPQDSYAQSSGPKYLDDVMDALLVTWTVTALPAPGSARSPSGRVYATIRSRTRKVLEKLFRAQPSEVIVSGINVWAIKSSDVDDTAVFDCIDVLAPSAQKVVEVVCDNLGNKQGRSGFVDRRPDPAFMAFLEAYITRLEGPVAVQVWNTLYTYARDVLGMANTPSARSQLFSVLRCLTVLGRIVAMTSALEDKRLRRDLQDVYAKVLDLVVGNIGRLAEIVVWERNALDSIVNGDHAEKDASQITADGTIKIHEFIATDVIPSLRTFLVDNDKVAGACSTISVGIVAPAFKQQRVDASILGILTEMTKIPAAVKSWRLLIGDAFNDQRFFRASPAQTSLWRPLIRALMDSDKERLGDLLGRIAAAPSANIFTNREQEMLVRSLNLRRLSFVLLAGPNNGQLTMLPSIQEKLVEILRTSVVSPRVHSEVYLCLRVLMCRISPQHLTNFWPVILAELLRVFETTMDNPPADGSEDLQLVLAACKFLDLLLVIQSEDFQIHQWMFVTDTTDAAYPPDGYQPESIMDRLSEILTEHAHATLTIDAPLEPAINVAGPRRPRLAHVRTLTQLHQLHTFFARASIDTFEGVYANGGVDWEAVEDGLVGEIFEGRE